MKHPKPPSHVVSITPNFIRLKMETNKAWNEARKLGAKWRWFPPAFGVTYASQEQLTTTLAALRDVGFVFPQGNEANAPATKMEEFVDRALISPGFTSLEFLGAGAWTLHKNEKRPLVRPFFVKPGKSGT